MATSNVTQEKTHVLIALPAKMTGEACAQFAKECREWAKFPQKLIVFDFKVVDLVDNDFFRRFSLFSQLSKSGNFHIASVGMNNSIVNQATEAKVSALFNITESVESALKMLQGIEKRAKTYAKFMQTLMVSVKSVFESQFDVTIVTGKPFKKGTEKQELIHVAGSAEFSIPSFSGSLTLGFPFKTYVNVGRGLIGEDPTTQERGLEDLAAELLSIVMGKARTELLLAKIELPRLIPRALQADGLRDLAKQADKVLVIPFSGSLGIFYFEILVEEQKAK